MAAEPTFPTGAVAVTGISCWDTTCVAIGTPSPSSGSTAAVWTGDLTSTPDNWVQSNQIPNSVASASGVTCGEPAGTDTADCMVSAESSAGAGPGELFLGSLHGAWAWNPVSSVRQLGAVLRGSGVREPFGRRQRLRRGRRKLDRACRPHLSEWTHGHLVGPDTFQHAERQHPFGNPRPGRAHVHHGVDRLYPTRLPSQSQPSLPVDQRLFRGRRPVQRRGRRLLLRSRPYPARAPRPSAPLGLLPLSLTNSTGAPANNGTVTLTDTTCGASGTTYNMPLTDATGNTMTSVPYGTYSYSVTWVRSRWRRPTSA